MSKEELENYKNRMDGGKPQFKGGDDKADFVDSSGKKWLAKKDETLPELKERASGQKIPGKSLPEQEEGEDV